MSAYINDYILVNEIGDSDQAFDSLVNLFNELGVPINQDKLPPCKKLACLGISIDTSNNIISIDKDKLEQIHEECTSISSKKFLSKRAFHHYWVRFSIAPHAYSSIES